MGSKAETAMIVKTKESERSNKRKIQKLMGVRELEQISREMSRLATSEDDDFARFRKRILSALQKITGVR